MSKRTEQVGELLRREVAAIFEKELPRNGTLTTIVDVRITPDLSIVRFYLSIMGNKDMAKAVMQHIEKENKHFRKELSMRIRNQFRRMPELEFYIDELPEKISRIEQLLREAKAGERHDDGNENAS
jgi:ribosome-binding factor A